MDDTAALFDVEEEVISHSAPTNSPSSIDANLGVIEDPRSSALSNQNLYSWNVVETKFSDNNEKIRINPKHLWKVTKSVEFITNNNHIITWEPDQNWKDSFDGAKFPTISLNWKEGLGEDVLKTYPDTQLKEIFIKDNNNKYHSIFKDSKFPNIRSVPSGTFKIDKHE